MAPRRKSLDEALAPTWTWQGLESRRHHSRDSSRHGRAEPREKPRAIDEDLVDGLTALEIEGLAANGAFDRPNRPHTRGKERERKESSSDDDACSVCGAEPRGYRDTTYERPPGPEARGYDEAHDLRSYRGSRRSGFDCLLDRCTKRFERLDDLRVHQEKRHPTALKRQARGSRSFEDSNEAGPSVGRRLGEGRNGTIHGQPDDNDSDGFHSDPCEVCHCEAKSARNRLSKPTTSHDVKKGKQPQSRITRSSHRMQGSSKLSKSSRKGSSSHSKQAYREKSAGFFQNSQRTTSSSSSSSKKRVVMSLPRPLVTTRPGWPRRMSGGPYMSGALQVPGDLHSGGGRAGPSNRVGHYDSGSDNQWDYVDEPASYEDPGPSRVNGPLQKGAGKHWDHRQTESTHHNDAETTRELTTPRDRGTIDDPDYQAAIHASLHDSRAENRTPPNPAVEELDNTSDFYLMSSDRVWKQVAGILGHTEDTPNMISLSKLTQLGYDAKQFDRHQVLSYAIDFNQEAKTLGCIPLWYTTLRGTPDRKPKKLLFEVFDAENFPWDVVLKEKSTKIEAGAAAENSTMPINFGDWSKLNRDERDELGRRNRRRQKEMRRTSEAVDRR